MSRMYRGYANFGALLLLAGSLAFAEAPEFREIIIDAGFKVDHPALIANLDGEYGHHLVLAGQDAEFTQRISIYQVDENPTGEATLVAGLTPDSNLIGYDVAKIDGREMLMFIEPGRITRFNLDKKKSIEFLAVSSFYRQKRNGAIIPMNFFHDVNLDETDDLIVPDIDGYRVRLQGADGELAAETVLQDSVLMDLAGANVRFDGRRLFSGDMDFDDLVDLGYWSGDTLGIYNQVSDMRFSEAPVQRPSGLDVLSEAEKKALEDGMGAVDRKGLTERDIESIKELNGDGIPDIIAESTHSDGVFDRRNEYSVHLGRQNGGQVEYITEEDALITFKGIQFGLISTDIDGDGKQDLVVRKAKLSLGRVIRALFSGSVSVEIHFHRMTDDDTYPDQANFVAKTKVHFSLSSGQVDIPAVVVDDFDGDGRQDLIVQTKPDRLSFYAGESSNELFAKKPSYIEVDLPRNGELVKAGDINDDGRADLIVRYNESDAAGMANKVRLMISTVGFDPISD